MDAKQLAVELQLSAKRGTASGEQVNAVVETLLEMADKLERLEAENARLLCGARELESDNAMRRRIADDQMDVSKDRKQTVAALTAKVKELEAENAELRELAVSNENGREYEYRRANGLARKFEAYERVITRIEGQRANLDGFRCAELQTLEWVLGMFREAGWEES